MLKTIRSLSIAAVLVASYAAAEVPQVDLNEAVSNPSLVAAIGRLKVDTSDDAKDMLLLELNQSRYLVPILPEELSSSAANQSGVTELEQARTTQLILTSDAEGNMYLPLFTDWDVLREYMDRPVNTLVFTPHEAWYWAAQMLDTDIIINPGKNALPLPKDLIQFLYSQAEAP